MIALQSDLIDTHQFVDVCTLWSSRKSSTLAEVLIQKEWLNEEDRAHVDCLPQQGIAKQGGDVRQSLTVAPVDRKLALASINDESLRPSIRVLEESTSIGS